MEQPNYPATERLYTLFKFLVLGLLLAALFSLLRNDTIFGLEMNAPSSEVVKSDGFADGIVPAGGLDVSDDNDEDDSGDDTLEPTVLPTPTLRPTTSSATLQAPATPTAATTDGSALEDAEISWDSAMIDAGFEILTLGGDAPFGEDIRVLLNNDAIEDVEISRDDKWVATTSVPSSGTHIVMVELLDGESVIKRFQRELEVPERP